MPTQQDLQLVDLLIKGTKEGQIDWKKTAVPLQYTTTLKGRFPLLVDKEEDEDFYWVSILNEEGARLRLADSNDYAPIADLFAVAGRQAFKVDEIVKGLLEDLKSKEK